MRIELTTLSEMPVAIESYGDKVSSLLNLGSHLRDQPFAVIQKKMFGGKGEIFTEDRVIKFKSNGGFTKLKSQETVNYSDIVEFKPFGSSTSLEWNFNGSAGEFSIGLIFYGSVKGINPRDVFWYEIDDFPLRSRAFYTLISKVLPETGVTLDLKAQAVSLKLKEAIEFFEGRRTAEDIGFELNLNNAKYPGFAAIQEAFARFLAGTSLATETNRDSYLDIFRSLDGIFVRILKKLMTEYNTKLGNIFNREQKIYEADEKFQRLSAIWYLRQIANLHFASEYLPEDETRAWPMKVLQPRARHHTSNNRRTVSIKLPEPEVYEEAIEKLEK